MGLNNQQWLPLPKTMSNNLSNSVYDAANQPINVTWTNNFDQPAANQFYLTNFNQSTNPCSAPTYDGQISTKQSACTKQVKPKNQKNTIFYQPSEHHICDPKAPLPNAPKHPTHRATERDARRRISLDAHWAAVEWEDCCDCGCAVRSCAGLDGAQALNMIIVKYK